MTDATMKHNMDDVAVANTFTCRWEYQPYINMAEKHGYTVNVIECKSDFGSVHNVPKHAVKRMRERWEHHVD